MERKWLMMAALLPLLLWSGAGRAADVARSYALPDTGQLRCYDDRGRPGCAAPGQAFFGQDADYAGAAPSYRDHGDGTVSDLITGLMWEKAFHLLRWDQAPEVAAGLRTGGYADWRVPSIKELYSLMDFSGATGRMPPSASTVPADARPYLNTAVFDFEYPRVGRFIDAQYVSSTTYGGRTMFGDRAFFGVNFADGRIKAYPQDGGPGRRLWYGRMVRGNPAYGRNLLTAPGDGTIHDRATGLVWTQGDSGAAAFRPALAATRHGDGRLDWAEALAFCEGLDFAGRRDWRLPNAKELHSIVDYGRAPDSTGSASIDPLFAVTAIRDGLGRTDWPYFWTATSHLDGRVPGDFAVYVAFGRALGNLPGPMGLQLLDVHGAGAQRSSPKSGDEARLPLGAGPQGDVLRIYNFARCVADGGA